jgi:hypothetical protein
MTILTHFLLFDFMNFFFNVCSGQMYQLKSVSAQQHTILDIYAFSVLVPLLGLEPRLLDRTPHIFSFMRYLALIPRISAFFRTRIKSHEFVVGTSRVWADRPWVLSTGLGQNFTSRPMTACAENPAQSVDFLFKR